MKETRAANRPAYVDKTTTEALNREIAAVRWAHHRLIDIEVGFEAKLQAAAEEIAPGITRIGRIITTLRRRARRRKRQSGGWSPNPRPELCERLSGRLRELRDKRNVDPQWKKACSWASEAEPDAPYVLRRRKAGETEESFQARCAAGKQRSRRDQARVELYEQTRCHANSWCAAVRAVDAARSAVVKQRKAGVASDIHRPRYRDPATVTSDSAWRVVARNGPWWTIEMPVGRSTCDSSGVVRFRAKLGNAGIDTATLRRLSLTRHQDGCGWRYTVSVVVKSEAPQFAGTGVVGVDWGHRERGHENQRDGMRAFTWHGADGQSGEILLPIECREQLDRIQHEQSRIDTAWDVRKKAMELPDRSRQGYRRRLMVSGVRTEEEARWLSWEMRLERRCQSARKRIMNLRRETYIQAVRGLRTRYGTVVVEDQAAQRMKDLDTDEMTRHRKRQNRDMVARYEFVLLCKRYGATVLEVNAKNTTAECPDCGTLADKTEDITIVCPGCGKTRDRDYGAARVILARGQKKLAEKEGRKQERAIG